MKEPIRVLQVFQIMDRGGAESMIMNLYRKIDRSKVQFDFLVHINHKGQFDDEIMALGGHIYCLNMRFNAVNAIQYYMACCTFFKEHPYSIVHGHLGSCAAIYLSAAKKYGAYTIAHSHSAQMNIRNLHDFLYRVFAFPTRYISDHLFGCSTEAGKARFGGKAVRSKKYLNFQNAIDLNRFSYSQEKRDSIRKLFSIGENQKAFISIGRITAPKNPDMIFGVFRWIVENDSNAVCLWVGTGEKEEIYRNMIAQEGLSDRIIMTGVRSDIPDLLCGADCFLFPSLWEGLPVSVIEAQATGIPCVLSTTITRETEVSDLIEWVDLNQDYSIWGRKCLEMAEKYKRARIDTHAYIRKHGYDICETAQWLRDFYISHYH